MIGSLLNYVTKGPVGKFEPMNTNFGLLPLDAKAQRLRKEIKKNYLIERARSEFNSWRTAQTNLETEKIPTEERNRPDGENLLGLR